MADLVTALADLLEALEIRLQTAFAGTDWFVVEGGPPDAVTPPAVWVELGDTEISPGSRGVTVFVRIVAAINLAQGAPTLVRDLDAIDRITPVVSILERQTWRSTPEKVDVGGVPHNARVFVVSAIYPDC